MIMSGEEVHRSRDEGNAGCDANHYSNLLSTAAASAPDQRFQSRYSTSSSHSTASQEQNQVSLDQARASPDTSKPTSASPHHSFTIDDSGKVEHQRPSGPIDIALGPWGDSKIDCENRQDQRNSTSSYPCGGGWGATDQWVDRHSTSLEYPIDQTLWSRMTQGESPSMLRKSGGLGSFEVDYSHATRTSLLQSINDHAPLSHLRTSPGAEDFAILIGDLSPDLREIDVITQFLHPPPWPASHPLAQSLAQSGREGQDRIGPTAFKSIKSAKIVVDTDTGLSRGWGIALFATEADRRRALVEMQGIILTPSSGTSPGRPLQVCIADAKVVSSLSDLNSANATQSQSMMGREAGGLSPQNMYDQANTSSLRSQSYKDISPAASLARKSPTVGRYTTPSPMEIAMQSAQTPSPSTWGIATLPGFPTIPATGASGPVDVGLRSGVALGSSYGGPASLGGTHFTLGPATLPSPSSALDPNNTTVFVGGLSSLISEETLKTFFSPFGHIAYVKIPPGKGCGFVSFLRKIDAERAIERMQGFPIGGSRIRLSWGRSQGEKNQQLAQMQINSLANWASTDEYHSVDGFASPQQQKLVYQSHDTNSTSRNIITPGAVNPDGAANPYRGNGGGDAATQHFLSRYHAYANGRSQYRDAHTLAVKAHLDRYYGSEQGVGRYPYPVSAHQQSRLNESGPELRETALREESSSRDDDVASLFDRIEIAAGRSGTESGAYGNDWALTASTGSGYPAFRANGGKAVAPTSYNGQGQSQLPLPLQTAATVGTKRSSPFSSTVPLTSPWEDRASKNASQIPYHGSKEDEMATSAGVGSAGGGGYFGGGSSSGASTWQDHSIAGSSFRSDTTPDSLTSGITGTGGVGTVAGGSAGFSPFSPLIKPDRVLEPQPVVSTQQERTPQQWPTEN